MACHHSEPGFNIFNESRLTLALPALKIFKISASSVKSSGCVSSFPRLSKTKRIHLLQPRYGFRYGRQKTAAKSKTLMAVYSTISV